MRTYSASKYFPNPSKARRRKPMRAWLVHLKCDAMGFTHWIVSAPSLDEAFNLACELPGAKLEVPRLGMLFDEGSWPDFARHNLKQLCDHCTPKNVIMLAPEERQWQSYAEQYAEHLRKTGVLQ